MQVRMLADDLTGAADSAAPFAHRGLSSCVCLRSEAPLPAAALVAVVTDSRRRPRGEAAAAVARAAALFPDEPGILSFKKIDSLLRGSPAAETGAALAAWGLSRAVVAPALPALGRTTAGGVQLVHGVPVDQAAGRNEAAVTADVRRLFSGLPCIVYDARTDADLDRIVERHRDEQALWVGSAGLAAAIARRVGVPGGRPAGARPRARTVLVVAGSRTIVTAGQIAALGAEDCAQNAERARRALESAGVAVMRADSAAGWAGLVAAAASVAADCLVLTGGDTALAVLRRQGVGRIDLLGEPRPGTALARDPASGRLLVLKSGSFGGDAALRDMVCWLRGEVA